MLQTPTYHLKDGKQPKRSSAFKIVAVTDDYAIIFDGCFPAFELFDLKQDKSKMLLCSFDMCAPSAKSTTTSYVRAMKGIMSNIEFVDHGYKKGKISKEFFLNMADDLGLDILLKD